MPLPSWDFFLLSCGTVIVLFSFLLGRQQTAKLIFVSYVSILTADALGLLVLKYLLNPDVINLLPGAQAVAAMTTAKIFAAIGMTILLVRNEQVSIALPESGSKTVSFLTSALLGALAAALMLAALVVFSTGGSFLPGNTIAEVADVSIQPLLEESRMVGFLGEHPGLIFSLPAIVLFLLMSGA
jgi:hypothetical protein